MSYIIYIYTIICISHKELGPIKYEELLQMNKKMNKKKKLNEKQEEI